MLGTLLAPILRPGAYAARQSSASSDSAASMWGYGGGTASGRVVSAGQSTTISAVFNAVTLLSDAVKVLPLMVYERTTNGKSSASDHPVYRLLHDSPNPQMSPSRFKKLLMTWTLLWGSGPCEIERSMGGDPIALWPIHPARRNKRREKDGSISHVVYDDAGRAYLIPDENVFEVMGHCQDGLNGMSIIGLARESLGLTVAAEEYGARFFRKDAAPQVVLEHPGSLSEDARIKIRTSWGRLYGPNGEGEGVAVLQEGMKVNRFGMPNQDAQFLETRSFQIAEIARWFNIPPHKLKDLSRATFNNIEHQGIEYVGDTVLPWLVEIEEECDRKLIRTEDRQRYFAEFLVDALLRADATSRATAFQIQRQNGIISANEWRSKENMNSLGPDGDIYIVPANMQTYEQARKAAEPKSQPAQAQTPPAEPDDGDAEDDVSEPDSNARRETIEAAIVNAHADMIADALQRMKMIESTEGKRAASKPDKFSDWVAKFYPAHAARMRAAIFPCVNSLANCLGVFRGAESGADHSAVVNQFVGESVSATVDSMREWFAVNPCDTKPIDDSDPDAEGKMLAIEFAEVFEVRK